MNTQKPSKYPAHVVHQVFGPDATSLRGTIPVVRIAPQCDAVIVSLGASQGETRRIADAVAAQWNAHDDLVAALRLAESFIGDAYAETMDQEAFRRYNIIRAALAKAGAA